MCFHLVLQLISGHTTHLVSAIIGVAFTADNFAKHVPKLFFTLGLEGFLITCLGQRLDKVSLLVGDVGR